MGKSIESFRGMIGDHYFGSVNGVDWVPLSRRLVSGDRGVLLALLERGPTLDLKELHDQGAKAKTLFHVTVVNPSNKPSSAPPLLRATKEKKRAKKEKTPPEDDAA